MPLATSGKTVPLWLESDAEFPAETRPTFLCRYMTRHEIEQCINELDAIPKLKMDEAHTRIDAILARYVTGWQNVSEPNAGPIGFAPDRFDRVLTGDEKWELVCRLPYAVSLMHQPSPPVPQAAESKRKTSPKRKV